MSGKKIKLVLCWHMHQPYYIDTSRNEYILPWTYLHAIKDYADMASHLEAVPEACAVVNFAPILLEQIDDYAKQLRNWTLVNAKFRDPLLAALAAKDITQCLKESGYPLIKSCLRANEERLIKRFPQYARLAALANYYLSHEDLAPYISEQFLSDIVVWYHLAWMGEAVRREHEVIQALIEKEKNFTEQDRYALLNVIAELLEGIIPRYRKLAENGQVELAFSPYAHPIIPLMLDFQSAKQAAPEMPLPECQKYPDGKARAEWHFQHGMNVFESYFGFKPAGCWPSEGSVSDETIALCAALGIGWVASGESVLRNSLAKLDNTAGCIHHPYQLENVPVNCFFRDDGLSDLIGFNYSSWHADDAVNNLVHHIENIAAACPDKDNAVVSVILDGENAWEYYPENAYYFLSNLYQTLSSHDNIELTTFANCVESKLQTRKLPHVVAGSWVYGTFSTWIGDKEKNHAWNLLCSAKRAYDEVMENNPFDEKTTKKIKQQLAICEGSDWFWWFGDYNPSDSVKDFDVLYRKHLRELYHLLEQPVPEVLNQVISQGGGDPAAGGVMRQGSE
ncbi:MAG TPA: glycoside hydrolase [Gammaproteobacteria bacterium]|nr:glycoside hydrolase [Gammaproteobacteria bacterium]